MKRRGAMMYPLLMDTMPVKTDNNEDEIIVDTSIPAIDLSLSKLN